MEIQQKLGKGRAALQTLIEEQLSPQKLVDRVVAIIGDPDLSRTQARRTAGDLIKYLGDHLPQDARTSLQEAIVAKPATGPTESTAGRNQYGDIYSW